MFCATMCGPIAMASSQCMSSWAVRGSHPGLITDTGRDADVYAIHRWDPDGPGPQQPLLAVAGAFASAGGVSARNLAAYNPATNTWSEIGGGTDLAAYSLASLPSGELLVGGQFAFAGNVSASGIASWNGSAWSALSTGVSAPSSMNVRRMQVMSNGDVVVTGTFNTAGGIAASNIARWNGSTWSALGLGLDNEGRSLGLLPNGDLVAGGEFHVAGLTPADHVARWDGSNWSDMDGGTNHWVRSCGLLSNGSFVACGPFSMASNTTVNGVTIWDGVAWTPLANGIPAASIVSCTELPGGNLLACGSFSIVNGQPASGLAEWDGSSWAPFAVGLDDDVRQAVVWPNGDVYVAGWFQVAGGRGVNHLARWDGSEWWPLGSGLNGRISSLCTTPNGDIIAGGDFHTNGTTASSFVGQRNGSMWSAMGTGMNESVLAVTARANGNVVAGGKFNLADGIPSNHIAEWDGATWSALGSGVPFDVFTCLEHSSGKIVAGGFSTFGSSFVSEWDGTSWTAIGNSNVGFAWSLAELPNGDLVAGGLRISRRNGAAWATIGTPTTPSFGPAVFALAVMPNGDLVAGGRFTAINGVPANSIARWNGTSWSAFGSGIVATGYLAEVHSLTVLPNGDVVAGGSFTSAGGLAVNNLAKWNGSTWSSLAQGTDNQVAALTLTANDNVACGGNFTEVGGQLGVFFAQLQTNCQATAVPYGIGCTGPGGTLHLTATSLPWLGASLETTTSGLGSASVGFAMISTTQTPPGAFPLDPNLVGIVPGPGIGCDLLIGSILLSGPTQPFGASGQSFAVPIPTAAGLPGLTFYMQVAELDFGSGWIGTYTSNALACTMGDF